MSSFSSETKRPEQPLRDRSIPEIARTLNDVLGPVITAHALAEEDTTVIERFVSGEEEPSPIVDSTIRELAEVTEVLSSHDDVSPQEVQQRLLAANPLLGGQAAVDLFFQGESDKVVSLANRL